MQYFKNSISNEQLQTADNYISCEGAGPSVLLVKFIARSETGRLIFKIPN